MKILRNFLLILIITAFSLPAFSQQAGDAVSLIKEGVALHDQGKYSEAIDKYKEAIKIDPQNYRAYYELSFSLYVSGKGKEALTYLEKVTESNSPLQADGYDLVGNIYDDDNQPDKAIDSYKKGILANPGYQRLHFNLAITYLRQKNNAAAESEALKAIKLDPRHASSQRIYAIATYRETKRGCSLLAWCSFLMLEPDTKRSAEAFAYVKNIVNYGLKKTGEKSITITISPDNPANLIMPMSVATATDNKKDLTAVDSLQLQLTSLFKISHTITGDKENEFVSKYFADYFEKLGNSDNMPAFTRLISLTAYKEENVTWLKDNEKQSANLDTWIATTKREQ